MKSPATKSASKKADPIGAGTVQIAVWRDKTDLMLVEEAMNNGGDVFFDFSRPLQILDSPGWSSQIKTNSDGGFFVFSLDDRLY